MHGVVGDDGEINKSLNKLVRGKQAKSTPSRPVRWLCEKKLDAFPFNGAGRILSHFRGSTNPPRYVLGSPYETKPSKGVKGVKGVKGADVKSS